MQMRSNFSLEWQSHHVLYKEVGIGIQQCCIDYFNLFSYKDVMCANGIKNPGCRPRGVTRIDRTGGQDQKMREPNAKSN